MSSNLIWKTSLLELVCLCLVGYRMYFIQDGNYEACRTAHVSDDALHGRHIHHLVESAGQTSQSVRRSVRPIVCTQAMPAPKVRGTIHIQSQKDRRHVIDS